MCVLEYMASQIHGVEKKTPFEILNKISVQYENKRFNQHRLTSGVDMITSCRVNDFCLKIDCRY